VTDNLKADTWVGPYDMKKASISAGLLFLNISPSLSVVILNEVKNPHLNLKTDSSLRSE
jgi:hypothetical protein